MINKKKILAVIPAKGTSKRIKRRGIGGHLRTAFQHEWCSGSTKTN